MQKIKFIKKASSIFLCATFLVSSFTIGTSAATSNNQLNITDVTQMQKIAAGIVSCTNEDLQRYDFNGDGVINVTDITIAQKKLAGAVSETTQPTTKPTVQPTTQPTTEKPTVKPSKPPTTSVPKSITVNKSSLTLGVGERYRLITTCDVANATITYSSNNKAVATVGTDGTITAKKSGTAVVTCKTSNGLTAKCTVVVKTMSSSVSLNKTSLELGIGEEYKLLVSIDDDSAAYFRYFSSSNTKVATVNGSGNIKAISVGSATISCKLSNGKTATCKVTVGEMTQSVTLNKTSLTLGVGEKFDINSYIPDGTSAYFRWYTSNNPSVVSVEKGSGVATAKKQGTAKITCELYNGVNATCTITVKSAPTIISLSVSSKPLKVGENFIISEKTNSGSYAYNFTWNSSNSKVATVKKTSGNKAQISPKMQGTTIITVKTYNGKTATCKVTVSGSTVKCIDISTWQGHNVDFNKIKSDGINYVIIRAGYGKEVSQKDDTFETNYAKAKAAGLKVGVYWFSYAMSPSEAIKEANACLNCLAGKKLDLPVYFDLEYMPALSGLSNSTLTQMCLNFCETIENNGYDAGVYSSASVYSWQIDRDKIAKNYSIWNAEWSNSCSINCDIWQYSEKGQVNGVPTRTDMSYIYNLNIVR